MNRPTVSITGKAREAFIQELTAKIGSRDTDRSVELALGVLLKRWNNDDRDPLKAADIAQDLQTLANDGRISPRAREAADSLVTGCYGRHAVAGASSLAVPRAREVGR